MFEFIKKAFFMGLAILSSVNPLSATSLSAVQLKYISVTNQECKVRPEIIHVNSAEPAFYPFCNKASKYSGSCSNMKDPYAKLCVPEVIKNLNVKVFNLMSRTNET